MTDFTHSLAVVIGIDAHEHSLPQQSSAISSAARRQPGDVVACGAKSTRPIAQIAYADIYPCVFGTRLTIVSGPSDVRSLAVEREWQNLQSAPSPLVQRCVIAPERLEMAALSVMQARRRHGPVDLLHFVSHGFFHRQENPGWLVFENERVFVQQAPAEILDMLMHDPCGSVGDPP